MEISVIVNIIFIVIAAGLSIRPRTRPLILLVAAGWLVNVGVRSYSVDHDKTILVGSLILLLGLVANFIRNYKNYVRTVTGKPSQD